MAVADYAARGFKDDVPLAHLASGVSNSATTFTLDSSTGWSGTTSDGPAGGVINAGEADEEFFFFAGVSGSDLTGVTRLNGQAHAAGATVQHSSGARDFKEANKIVSGLALCNARVYNDANISVANETFVDLTFNTERFDGAALHDTGGNTGRLTAPRAGKYLITCTVQWATNATGQRIISLRANGATTLARDARLAGSTGVIPVMTVTTVYNLAASDYVTVNVYQNSGGALNVEAAAAYSPEFAMQWLAP